MQSTALVSLDCVAGTVKRYLRVAGNKPRETGRLVIPDWRGQGDDSVNWPAFGDFLRAWRGAYEPPEDDGPRPTSPLRNVRELRAA